MYAMKINGTWHVGTCLIVCLLTGSVASISTYVFSVQCCAVFCLVSDNYWMHFQTLKNLQALSVHELRFDGCRDENEPSTVKTEETEAETARSEAQSVELADEDEEEDEEEFDDDDYSSVVSVSLQSGNRRTSVTRKNI